ncbi:armadillo-type fold protein, partial [Tanacetum coccineum]
ILAGKLLFEVSNWLFHCLIFLLLILMVMLGSLPPSCRRSLYTLATTMIIVSGKAFIIVPLVPGAKSTLAKEDERAPLKSHGSVKGICL